MPPVLLREENNEAKEEARSQCTFNGSHENIELLLRTVISANQLSIYGAVAVLCNEVPKDLRAPVKPAAPDHLEKMEIPTDLSIAENSNNAQQRRNPVQEHERKNRTIVRRPEIIQTLFCCGFEACRTRTKFLFSRYRRRTTDANIMPRIYDASQ